MRVFKNKYLTNGYKCNENEKYNDGFEYLFVYDKPQKETLYDKDEAELDIEKGAYDFDRENLYFEKFRQRTKDLHLIAYVNTGFNCTDMFWVDKYSGRISVSDSGDEMSFRWNICKNIEELIHTFDEYIDLFEKGVLTQKIIEESTGGFASLLVHNEYEFTYINKNEPVLLVDFYESNEKCSGQENDELEHNYTEIINFINTYKGVFEDEFQVTFNKQCMDCMDCNKEFCRYNNKTYCKNCFEIMIEVQLEIIDDILLK